MGKSDLDQNYDIGISEMQKNVPRSREISESPKLPVGPAKERNRRRVLRTMCKKLFIMRRCAVKHVLSLEISLENLVFYEISHFHENLQFFKFYLFGYMHWTLDAHSNVNVG